MLLKETIAKLIQKNQQTKTFISTVYKSNHADDSITGYASSLELLNYDSSLSLPLAYLLQFGSDPKVVEAYELDDIEKLYDSIIELSSEWGNAYIDAANFADAVMDNKQRAKELVDDGIKQLEEQLRELKELSALLNKG